MHRPDRRLGVRLRVRGGVRALVAMLSADISRDNRYARVRARAQQLAILSLRNRVFFHAMRWEHAGSGISSEG